MRHDTIDRYLWDLAARVPAPGGGATAGLHLAQAAALLGRVARHGDGVPDRHRDTVRSVRNRADELRALGMRLGDDDSRRVPAQVVRAAAEVVELAERLCPVGAPDVVSDVGAAADAARAAASTARLAAEADLRPIADPLVRLELDMALEGVDDVLRRADAVTSAVRARIRR